MDDELRKLNDSHGNSPNMLCVDGDLEKALQIGGEKGRYYPMNLAGMIDGQFIVADVHELFLGFDEEYDSIPSFFGLNLDGKVFYSFNNPFWPNHLLNLPNTPQDVRFRQEGVKEMTRRKDLYERVGEIIRGQRVYSHHQALDAYSCDVTPEEISNLLRTLESLAELNPESGPFRKLLEWTEETRGDTLFQELLRVKRRVTERRIFTGYSERYRDVIHYMLKPGVRPEDVFDIIHKDIVEREVGREEKRGKIKREFRRIVKFKDPIDEEIKDFPSWYARQRMDILNEATAKMLAVPGLLTMLQLKHLYQGAYMHRTLTDGGVPMTFPEIVDGEGVLELYDFLPTRMVLSGRKKEKGEELQENTLVLTPDKRIIQAEGPNWSGKSEAWRTVHINNGLINAGYSIPARKARVSVTPSSHFISCKGDEGHGGSELARSLHHLKDRLEFVHIGDQVILDELGDSSNAPTSREIAKRLLPELVKNGSRVFVTSHHSSATDYIEKELGGISLVPDPDGQGRGKFRLIPKKGSVDFRAGETLEKMEFTKEKIKEAMPKTKRKSRVRGKTRLEKHEEVHDDNLSFDDKPPF